MLFVEKLLGARKRRSVMALIVVAGLCVTTVTEASSKKHYLKLGAAMSLQIMNAKIRMFKYMAAKPLSPPTTLQWTMTSNGHASKVDVYPPKELWIRDNMLGEWRNNLCEIRFFEFKLPEPTSLQTLNSGGKQFISSEKYDEWKSGVLAKKIKWTNDMMAKWLSYSTGLTVGATPTELKKNSSQKAVVRLFPIQDTGNTDDRLYVVASTYVPDKWYAIWYHVIGGDKKRNKKALNNSIASLVFSPPSKHNKPISKERSLGGRNSKKSVTKRSEEYKKSRERVINAIKSMKNWWYFETTNFIFAADIKNKKTARELASTLEHCRSVFEKFYPLTKPFDAACVAKMFQERGEYVAYVGKKFEWTGGLWMPSKKELIVSPMNWGTRSDRRRMMVTVTNHESFHMYIYFACGERDTAVWFNEGNATFFQGLEFRGNKAHINTIYRMESMRKIAPRADIKTLLGMSYETFYGANQRENYTLGWGLMFFLWKGAPIMKEKNNYSEIPRKYYDAMLACGNGKKATEIAWKGVDMEQFERLFHKFWASKSLIRKAERYNAIPSAKSKKDSRTK